MLKRDTIFLFATLYTASYVYGAIDLKKLPNYYDRFTVNTTASMFLINEDPYANENTDNINICNHGLWDSSTGLVSEGKEVDGKFYGSNPHTTYSLIKGDDTTAVSCGMNAGDTHKLCYARIFNLTKHHCQSVFKAIFTLPRIKAGETTTDTFNKTVYFRPLGRFAVNPATGSPPTKRYIPPDKNLSEDLTSSIITSQKVYIAIDQRMFRKKVKICKCSDEDNECRSGAAKIVHENNVDNEKPVLTFTENSETECHDNLTDVAETDLHSNCQQNAVNDKITDNGSNSCPEDAKEVSKMAFKVSFHKLWAFGTPAFIRLVNFTRQEGPETCHVHTRYNWRVSAAEAAGIAGNSHGNTTPARGRNLIQLNEDIPYDKEEAASRSLDYCGGCKKLEIPIPFNGVEAVHKNTVVIPIWVKFMDEIPVRKDNMEVATAAEDKLKLEIDVDVELNHMSLIWRMEEYVKHVCIHNDVIKETANLSTGKPKLLAHQGFMCSYDGQCDKGYKLVMSDDRTSSDPAQRHKARMLCIYMMYNPKFGLEFAKSAGVNIPNANFNTFNNDPDLVFGLSYRPRDCALDCPV